jgi:hypothetical protein
LPIIPVCNSKSNARTKANQDRAGECGFDLEKAASNQLLDYFQVRYAGRLKIHLTRISRLGQALCSLSKDLQFEIERTEN